MNELIGKRALVTGSKSGIGFAIAKSQSNIDVGWIFIDNNDGKRYFSKSGEIQIKQMIYPLI